MKYIIVAALLTFSAVSFANNSQPNGRTGEQPTNSANPCVGCALREARMAQADRAAGKNLNQKKEAPKANNSGARQE
jgi:hypothetical protein